MNKERAQAGNEASRKIENHKNDVIEVKGIMK